MMGSGNRMRSHTDAGNFRIQIVAQKIQQRLGQRLFAARRAPGTRSRCPAPAARAALAFGSAFR